MTEKIYFSYPEYPYIFEWIKGTKTINVSLKEASYPRAAFTCITFGHEQKRTRIDQARKMIQNWLRDNK